MDEIINRLNNFGIAGQEFCDKLYETKTIMAGSFPLQCVLKEIYDDSADIDLYCHAELFESLLTFGNWFYHKYNTKTNNKRKYFIARPSITYVRNVSQAYLLRIVIAALIISK